MAPGKHLSDMLTLGSIKSWPIRETDLPVIDQRNLGTLKSRVKSFLKIIITLVDAIFECLLCTRHFITAILNYHKRLVK